MLILPCNALLSLPRSKWQTRINGRDAESMERCVALINCQLPRAENSVANEASATKYSLRELATASFVCVCQNAKAFNRARVLKQNTFHACEVPVSHFIPI